AGPACSYRRRTTAPLRRRSSDCCRRRTSATSSADRPVRWSPSRRTRRGIAPRSWHCSNVFRQQGIACMQPDNSYAWPLEPGLTTNDDWSAGDAADAPQKREWLPRSFAEWFALGLTFIPAILYLPGSQSYRLIARVAAYGISVAAFTLWWFDRAGRKETRHPAERWLTFVMAWLGLMMLNPGTINSLAGIAHVTLYFSILCPLFWTPAYITRRRHLVRLLAILLFCNGLNSLIGV